MRVLQLSSGKDNKIIITKLTGKKIYTKYFINPTRPGKIYEKIRSPFGIQLRCCGEIQDFYHVIEK